MKILYEDNHLLIVSKKAGEIVQGDKTGDQTLADIAKEYIKSKYNKPGNVYLGIPHRLDRPVSGICVFAKTSKCLSRMNDLFREGKVKKIYHAIIPKQTIPIKQGTLEHYLTRNKKQNKAYVYKNEVSQSKYAKLTYKIIKYSERYSLIEIQLFTGRHHQIRCQLAACLAPIKGDLKYGASRSNSDGSICLHARSIYFIHPIKKCPIYIEDNYPDLSIWKIFNSVN